MKYLRLSKLAHLYDVHTDTMKKRLRELDMKINEHFIVLHEGERDTLRFDVDKIHEALTAKNNPQKLQELLNKFLI